MARRFQPPIEIVDGEGDEPSWELNLPDEHRQVVAQLVGELRNLLTGGDTTSPLVLRLFPTAYPDDDEKEAEYQRLMREELVTSRVAQLDVAASLIGPDGPDRLSESDVVALMQSVNAIRLVLGTMLDVGEDDDDEPDDDTPEDEAQARHLYGFLSWLLEWTVRSMSG